MQLRADRVEGGWMLNAQNTWTTSAHLADDCWLGARTDRSSKDKGMTLSLIPMQQPGVTIRPVHTIRDECTNEVLFDDVFTSDESVVGKRNHGWTYICEALEGVRPVLRDLNGSRKWVGSASSAEPATLRDDASHTRYRPRPERRGSAGERSSPSAATLCVAAVQALEPRLRPHDVADQRHVDPRELAQPCELPRRLEDTLLEVAHPQLLGQRVGVSLVALQSPALRDPSDHELVDLWTQRLVEPGALQALLEDQVLAARDHPDRFHGESSWQSAMMIPYTGTRPASAWPLVSTGKSSSLRPFSEITANVQLAA
jgi:hypothetical protein